MTCMIRAIRLRDMLRSLPRLYADITLSCLCFADADYFSHGADAVAPLDSFVAA